MDSKIYCAIMAGGYGNRLWPLSQQIMPKQFLDLLGVGRTMLQMTFDRFRGLCGAENMIVVTNVEYVDLVKEQLPEVPSENILAEPFRRNTAACVAFASAFVKQKDPEAVFIVTPSDHLIVDEKHDFMDCIERSAAFAAKNDALMTIGVKAYKPETAFGYIQVGDAVSKTNNRVHKVKTFTEKPNAEMAQIFYECGEFCWNAGIFVWKVSSIEAALKKYMPDLQKQFDILDTLPASHWTEEAVRRAYDECENISIDYAVMEKAQNVYVVETSAAWNDLGSWEALYDIAPKDDCNNAVLYGNAVFKDSHNCLVRLKKNKICKIEGLDDYMVIEKGNCMIICPRKNANATWKYAAELKTAVKK